MEPIALAALYVLSLVCLTLWLRDTHLQRRITTLEHKAAQTERALVAMTKMVDDTCTLAIKAFDRLDGTSEKELPDDDAL